MQSHSRQALVACLHPDGRAAGENVDAIATSQRNDITRQGMRALIARNVQAIPCKQFTDIAFAVCLFETGLKKAAHFFSPTPSDVH